MTTYQAAIHYEFVPEIAESLTDDVCYRAEITLDGDLICLVRYQGKGKELQFFTDDEQEELSVYAQEIYPDSIDATRELIDGLIKDEIANQPF